MLSKVAIATLFASLVAAQTTLKNGDPADPIHRPLNEVVPACKPFTITWTANTPGPVKITLLKGPSTNVIPQFDIVASTANSGSFVWTPPATLAPTTGNTGYGLNLTDLTSGDYQYSTQFGISTDGCAVVSSSSVGPASSAASSGGYPVSTPVKPTSNGYPVSTPAKSSVPVYSTGAPAANSSYVVPTKPATMSSAGYPTSAVTSKIPTISGNAAPLVQAGGLVGAAAALALML